MSAGSIGREKPWPKGPHRLSVKWGGESLPALSMEKATPYDAKRSALASGPGKNSEHYDANLGS